MDLEGSGEPPGGLEVVGRPSRRSGRGREDLPGVQDRLEGPLGSLGDPSGGPGGVGMPS